MICYKVLSLFLLYHQACGVLLAQCPDGWQLWEGTNQCYILLTRPDTNTFDDSITLCRVRGGDLLSIPDKATKNWLRKILSATQLEGQDAYTWVGARLVNDSWVWVDTEEPVDNEMLPWDDGSDGKCAAFTTSSTLIKLSCSLRLNLVCHRPLGVPEACDHSKGWNQIGDFCYKSSGDTASWAVGRRGCVEQEANLLTITGGQEQQHAYDFALSLHDKVWIGLAETKHPGEWRWSDGTKVNFTHWSHAQPVSLGGFGAAVVNNVDIDGRWEVERVTDNYHYICKKKTGGCVAGWEEFAGACYYFITGNDDFLVWEDAKASCEDIGASLVVLETQDEDIFIRGHIPETESIWLGLYSKPKEEFYWMNGATIASYNFSFMKQEDTRIALSSNSSKCVFFQVSVWDKGLQKNSSWVPVDCQEAKFYACEVPAGTSLSLAPPSDVHCPRGWLKYQGHCYLPSYQQVTWSEARESCEEFGADLTSVLTWQEQDFIHNQQAASGWIGLQQKLSDRNWEWSDSSPVSITNWENGDHGGSEGCAELRKANGKWRAAPCQLHKAFTCKRRASKFPFDPITHPRPHVPEELPCGPGWTENPLTGECYYLVLEELTFHDASQHCRHHLQQQEIEKGSDDIPHLVSLTTIQEQLFVSSQVVNQHIGQTSLWLGLRNDYMDGNRWLDGSPVVYFNWDSRAPIGPLTDFCIEMYTGSGKWNDVSCEQRLIFICEKKAKKYTPPQTLPPPPEAQCPGGWRSWNHHCYYFSSDPVSWHQARAWCQDYLGSDLVSVTSKAENSFILGEVFRAKQDVWLGLYADGNTRSWSWVDGSNINRYHNWLGSHSATHGQCGELRADGTLLEGFWVPASCNTEKVFICKTTTEACPQGWTHYKGKCYFASGLEATWRVAQDSCVSYNARASLVSVSSQEENSFLVDSLIPKIGGNTWLGLTYDLLTSTWVWVDGRKNDYTNWNIGEPLHEGEDRCVELLSAQGKWTSLLCDNSRTFVCQLRAAHSISCEDGWIPFNDYCYWYSGSGNASTTLTFNDAHDNCRSRDASLASIHSDPENQLAFSLLDKYDPQDVFLGLSDDGHQEQLSWLDGSSLSYTNWHQFNSNPFLKVPVCGVLRQHRQEASRGTWSLRDCSSSLHYICKKPHQATLSFQNSSGCNEGDVVHRESCYHVPSLLGSWAQAKDFCVGNNGDLAVLNDRYESAFISSLLREVGESAWVGLAGTINPDRSVVFRWTNLDPVEYTNWGESQPAVTCGTCVAASGDDTSLGLWSVRSCDDSLRFICEYSRNDYDITTPSTPPPTAPVWPCVGDWMLINDRCYKVFLETTTWARGEALCLSYSGHLTSVGSRGEEDNIKRVLEMTLLEQTHPLIWVGLHLDGESGHVWSDGTAVQYVRWGIEQPDSHRGQLRCGTAYTSTLMLADADCYTFLPFICEAPQGMKHPTSPLTKSPDVLCDGDTSWLLFGDQCYRFFSASYDNPETWRSSRLRCREQGGELASIHTNEENYWILSKILGLSDEMVWVGGRSVLDSGYQWLDNTTFDFDNWARGEPNNILGQEDCIVLYSQQEGRWGDRSCDTLAGSICKRRHGTNPSTPAVTTATPLGHCLQGWLHSGSKCLKFSKEKKTFDGAVEACTSPSKLASIHSPQEQAFLTAVLGDLGTNVWLGLRNNQSFHWKDNTSVTYTSWAPGEPNGIDGEEGCVEASHVTGLWSDVPCTSTRGYVCMVDTDSHLMTEAPYTTCASPFSLYIAYNGACYHPHSTYKTWKEAETTCKDEGAHLVSVSEPTEGAFLWMLAKNHNFTQTWLGLHYSYDNSRFLWSDSTPTTYTNWGMSQPNTSLTNHACVWLNSMGGLWYSQLCDDLRPFVCKYKNVSVISHDPPATGRCPDARWLDLGNGFCYLVSQYKQPWDEARRTCVLENSNLASMHSEAEMIAVTVAIHGITDPLWIGLVKEEHGYGWSDRSGVDYVNWGVDEPGGGTDEGCVLVYTQTGSWSDTHCSTAAHYLCKTLKSMCNVYWLQDCKLSRVYAFSY
ncbi:macrophage mannose receptor 1-like [Homarus americanus]|uniref:macrophage mannose receptor 1-like n=1 Tax=Homarus americanus TaxID=6706 RepID=UPI001C473C08|nr:macrophage mannose receptor 1-like [Homarus americanus]